MASLEELNLCTRMIDNLGDNHISNWKGLRKGNWSMLNFLNIEVNKATEMKWLTELDTCINSLIENETVFDSIFCAKLRVSEPTIFCKLIVI